MNDTTQRAISALMLSLVAAAGVYMTSHTVHSPTVGDWLGLVGGYVTAAAYVMLTIALVFLFERMIFPGVDFFEEIVRERNLALAVLLGLALIAFAIAASGVSVQSAFSQTPDVQDVMQDVETKPIQGAGLQSDTPEREGEGVWTRTRCIRPGAQMPIVAFVPPVDVRRPTAADTARRWTGRTERPPGSNEGPAVERFLASVGLEGGYPWCAAALSYWYDRAGVEGPKGDRSEVIRSAGAINFAGGRRAIDPAAVLRGHRVVPKGSAVIWKRRGTWKGHAGVTARRWDGRCGRTIEGNTRPAQN